MLSILQLVWLAFGAHAYAGHEALVGVLEEKREGHSVRVCFQSKASEWTALQSECPTPACLKTLPEKFPASMKWTIAFDGKNLGTVETKRPKEFKLYADVGQQEISSGATIPAKGEATEEFSGFSGGKVHRPLVAVSVPNFKDPESWRPASLSASLQKKARLAFREKFAKVSNCKNPDENKSEPWKYVDSDIKIGKSYLSSKKYALIRADLQEYRCDGPPPEAFETHWFLATPGGAVRFLDTGLILVDAGDYDGDGSSEVIFQIARYNRGGYKLFSENFTKQSTFTFSYH